MVFGWVFAGHQLGAAVAAYGAGKIRTLTLTYDPAVYAAGAARERDAPDGAARRDRPLTPPC